MIEPRHALVIARCERRLDMLVWLWKDQRAFGHKFRLEACSECREWHASTDVGRTAHARRCRG